MSFSRRRSEAKAAMIMALIYGVSAFCFLLLMKLYYLFKLYINEL